MGNETEEWREATYNGAIFMVSSLGRVKNKKTGRLLTQTRRSTCVPYLRVSTRYNWKPVSVSVHRLVLMAFCGPCPDGMEGCHNDGDPTNNRADNLRWATHSENSRDKYTHGTMPFGERTSRAKATDEQIRWAMRKMFHGASSVELADKIGIHPATLRKRVASMKRRLSPLRALDA